MKDIDPELAGFLINMSGKITALELIVRAFMKGMAADKPDPHAFLLEKIEDLITSMRAAAKPTDEPAVIDAAERSLRFYAEQASFGIFATAVDQATANAPQNIREMAKEITGAGARKAPRH